jgi:hypothetical protein
MFPTPSSTSRVHTESGNNREKNREFCKIGASGAPETVDSAAAAGLQMQIPYSTEQGIISTEQGIQAREQGILLAIIRRTQFTSKCGWYAT